MNDDPERREGIKLWYLKEGKEMKEMRHGREREREMRRRGGVDE